jgi:DNA polymerase III subunit beta
VHGTPPVTSVIVPSRHLAEVARAVNPNRPTVGIAFAHARNQVFFTLKDVEISSRLIEGTYPNYTQVIPGESTTTVSLSTASLLREAKTAAVLARDAANPVRLRIGDGTLTLLAQTAEVGDDEAPLSATVKGDDVQIAFNARYMLDALSALDSDEVILSFNGSLQPGVIRPVGSDDYLCIIMPVRVA